eukprot:350481_1
MSHVTALNKCFFIDKPNGERIYGGYNVDIPHREHRQNVHEYSSTYVYSKISQRIYNLHKKQIFSLGLGDIFAKYWKKVTSNSLWCTETACMADNDRFIFGNKSKHKTFLYAFNSDKSIELTETIKEKRYGCSIYHDEFHKIIYGDVKSMEWYDMNKDKWLVINVSQKESHYNSLKNIWYSPFNQNIIYW